MALSPINIVSGRILKVLSLNAIATLVKMLTSFVSIKVVAVLIGPTGIALLGQLNNFTSIFLAASTGGINNGITKYIAENAQSPSKIRSFLSTGIRIILGLSILCGFILIIGASNFSVLILKDSSYRSIIILFGVTIFFYSLNNFLIAIVNGFKEFKIYVIANISGSIASLLITILLSYYFGLIGALIAAVTFQSIVVFITLYTCYRCHWFTFKQFFGSFDISIAKKLSNFSLMTLVSAATVPVSQLYIRGQIVANTSLVNAGIWEGMNRISGMYLMVIMSSLGVYYLPRLSEIMDEKELRREIFSMYRLFIPFLVLLTIIIYFSRDFIVFLLFTVDFKPMTELFFYQLIGDFFKLGSWLLSFIMVAKTMTKHYVITEIFFSISFSLLATYFINKVGYIGATVGYAINYFLYFLVMVLIFRKLIFKVG